MIQARRATAGEAEDVARLYLRCRKAAVPEIPPVAHSDQAVLRWMAQRITAGEECWVTSDATGVTGLMLLEPGWIDQLYIRPDRIGLGLGSRLVEVAKDEMPKGLQLWTFQSNRRAQRFYERHGFRSVEFTDGDGNEERSPDIRYEWAPVSL